LPEGTGLIVAGIPTSIAADLPAGVSIIETIHADDLG
jgi:hypothetical protein